MLLILGTVLTLVMFGFSMLAGGGNLSAEFGSIVCIMAVSLIIYGLPAIMLWKAAAGARQYAKSPGAAELAEFTSTQLGFWRTIGIIAAIVIGIYSLILIGVLVFGVSMAFADA